MPKKPRPKTQEYKVDVYDINGRKTEVLNLDKRVFDGRVNVDLLHQAMVMYAANKRKGTASTKTRSEVRGGGKKPWRQKGTGRARVGSIRNPIWRGGGIAFGPHPRDYSYTLPRKARLNAVKSALNSKLESKQLLVVDEIKLDQAKTKKMKAILAKFKIEGKTLLVLDKLDENIKRATRNLQMVSTKQPDEVCCDDLLRYGHLLITKGALQRLVKRLLS